MTEKRSENTADSLLKHVHVAAPCAESWAGMPGGETVRSCERCQHRVYNLSEMTAAEAEALLRDTEGRLCVRFYRRADGTIMTKDCPVGNQVARRRVAGAATVAAAAFAFTSGNALLGKPRTELPRWVQAIVNTLAPEPERAIMGKVASRVTELPMAPPVPAPDPPQEEMGEVVPVEEPIMGIMAPIPESPAPE